MANEFQHKDPGTELTQAEYITTDGTGHIFDCQATGDIMYASSATVLKNLGKGAANTVLSMGGSCIPAWTDSPSVTDLTIGGGCITLSAATDIDLLDNNASALSFDASGKTGIIDIVTTNCSEGVTMSGTLGVTGVLTSTGGITVGVCDTGLDVKFFGASAGAYLLYDQSCDQLEIRGAAADAATSTGKLLLSTALTNINACDVIGSINFQAPLEAGSCDAILVAAGIRAVAQATFTCAVNATDLIFYTGHSEAAAERFRFTSQNEIGIAGANYGTDGQVLTSGGAGAAVAWECAGGGGIASLAADTSPQVGGSAGLDLQAQLLVGNGGTTGIAISANGEVTMAAHPVSLAYNSATDSNVTGQSAAPFLDVDTEVFDQGGDFLNDIFTAPVTGRYLMVVNLFIGGITGSATQISVQAVVSNRNSYMYYDATAAGGSDIARCAAFIVDMDASDTAKVQIDNNGESSDVHDIVGTSDARTSLGFYLLA